MIVFLSCTARGGYLGMWLGPNAVSLGNRTDGRWTCRGMRWMVICSDRKLLPAIMRINVLAPAKVMSTR